ncbi:MAG: caspase family protein, partial [Chitinophagales bacterium]|nr:caspase family protein [Chitinophagales bacterium]
MKYLPLLLILSFPLSLCCQEFAIDDSSDPTVYSLAIGISNYNEERINDLQYAHNDAIIFKKYIENCFPRAKTYLYTDSLADETSIEIALNDILIDVNKGDTVFFFFSGHGDCDNKQSNDPGYLLSYETKPNSYFVSALSVRRLYDILKSCTLKKEAEVFIFLDACRSGSLLKDNPEGSGISLNTLLELFEKHTLFVSCKPDQSSIELSKYEHGLFSYFLIKGLEGDADIDDDHIILIDDLRNYLRDQIKNESNEGQIPMHRGDPDKKIITCSSNVIMPQAENDLSTFSKPRPKGNNANPNHSDKDTSTTDVKQIFKNFQESIKDKRIIEPADSCAYHYYQIFPSDESYAKTKAKMKIRVLEELKSSSTKIILEYIDNGIKNIDQFECGNTINHLNKALDILTSDDYFFSLFKSRLLFTSALQTHYDDSHDWLLAINSLEKAIELEPLAGYLYNELGVANVFNNNLEKAKYSFYKATQLSAKWGTPILHYYDLKDWEYAQKQNDVIAYEEYKYNNSNGFFVKNANDKISKLNDVNNSSNQIMDYALLIAVENYDAPEISSNTSLKKVDLLEKELNRSYGFKVDTLYNPSLFEIVRKLDFIQYAYENHKLSPFGQFLFYLDGVGYELKETGASFFLPRDVTNDKNITLKAINYDSLIVSLDAIKCDHILLVNNADSGQLIDAREINKFINTQNTPQELATTHRVSKSRLLLSTNSNHSSDFINDLITSLNRHYPHLNSVTTIHEIASSLESHNYLFKQFSTNDENATFVFTNNVYRPEFTQYLLKKNTISNKNRYTNKTFGGGSGVIHVNINAHEQGNGLSWSTPITSLHTALDRAKAGNTIWVAAGKYFTTKDNDQNKSFVIPQGVKIYGGFAGTETDINQRNLENNFTVLSGEIADKQNAYDNAFTVVTIKHANQYTLLNGLVIEKGNAIGNAGTAEGCGA